MVTSLLTKYLQNSVAKNPRNGVIIGLLFAALFGYFAVKCYQEVQIYSAGPISLTMEEAYQQSLKGEVYVRLTDAVTANCASAVLNSKSVYLPLRDAGGKIDIVASYDSPGKCVELEGSAVEGTMKKIFHRAQSRLEERGMSFAPEARSVCTNCGMANSMIGVVVCSVLFFASVSIIPLGYWQRRKSRVNASKAL